MVLFMLENSDGNIEDSYSTTYLSFTNESHEYIWRHWISSELTYVYRPHGIKIGAETNQLCSLSISNSFIYSNLYFIKK